jgi:hypothetical protein
MTDHMLTVEDQVALKSSVEAAHRVAARIVALPRDRQEQALAIVRHSYEAALREYGQDPKDAAQRARLDEAMQTLRLLISAMETDKARRCWPGFNALSRS